jgi:hypothetical protein
MMQSIDRALGVECTHCHTVDDWKADGKPEFAFAGRMIEMVEGLNAGTLGERAQISCWTCHRGNLKPARMPRASWQDHFDRWPADLKLSVDDAKKPARDVYKNIQSMSNSAAGSLQMTMSVFAGALGVPCDYCHVSGSWASDEKPAKRAAREMLDLFEEIPPYFEKSHQPGMQCYTCHQGSPKPYNTPPDIHGV